MPALAFDEMGIFSAFLNTNVDLHRVFLRAADNRVAKALAF